MKLIDRIVVLSAVSMLVFCITIPLVSFAVASTPGAGGLVPCAGPDCNFSHVLLFTNTIIDWLLWIAIPIAAALFSYVAILYVTSVGKPAKKTAANKIFQSTFKGFVLALSAWLVVNFLTNFFIDKGVDEVFVMVESAIIETYGSV